MREVEVVAAIDAAGDDDADRRLEGLHVADLHRRGVRAQQRRRADLRLRRTAAERCPSVRAPGPADDRRLQVERVLHVARGMIRRHVERFEVVEVVFDFRPFEDLVAHAREDVFDLLADAHQRVHAAERQLAAGQRHVDGAGGRPAGAERRAPLVERGLDLGLQLVDERADLAAELGRERAELLEQAA